MDNGLINKKLNISEDGFITSTETSIVSKKKCERKQTQHRKRKRSSSSSEDEDINNSMEKKLQEVAKRNNMNSVEMRRLIKSLVCNEHFLALVEFESENKKDVNSETKTNEAIPSADSIIDNIVDSKLLSNIKLTRSKAKKLKHSTFLGLPSLTEPAEFEPEVAALISAELHSDEDDEEYCPRDEEILSDEDPNTTVSDIDSQPSTPMTLTENIHNASPEHSAVYTSDGLFKIPTEKNHVEAQDEIIAKRTRSKLSLEQTPIEIIESNFNPPDSTQDLYETVFDEEWLEFLNDFNKPMTTTVVTDDDDPVADPEYIGGEKVPLDAEELRNVNISKKEINDLISELFSSFVEDGEDFDKITNLETSNNHLKCSDNSQKENSVKLTDNNISTLDLNSFSSILSDNGHSADAVPNSDAVDSYMTITSNCLQTVANTFIPETSVMLNPNDNLIAEEIINIPNELNINAIDVSTKQKKIVKNRRLNTKPKLLTYELPDLKEYVSIKQVLHSEYIEKFENLKFIEPSPETEFNDAKIGMTPIQNLIVQEQLRIHVQFIAQNFIQTYASPMFFKYAYKQKEMLTELHEQCEKLGLKVFNLMPAIEFIANWEKELSEDTDTNSQLMEFINSEVERTEQKSTHSTNIMKFPPRIMRTVLNSYYVFLYPQFLPRIPFRTNVRRNFLEFAPSEAYLIAFELEKHLKEAKDKITRKNKNPVIWACDKIGDGQLIVGKNGRRIYGFVNTCRNETNYNPIKYYFDKGRAVRFSYNPPRAIEYDCLIPLRYRADSLPLIWKKFALLLESGQDISDYKKNEQEQSIHANEAPIVLVNYIIHDSSIQPSQEKNTLKNNSLQSTNSTSCEEGNNLLESTQLLKGQKLITDFFNNKSQVNKFKQQNHRNAVRKLYSKNVRRKFIKNKRFKNVPKSLLRLKKKKLRARRLEKILKKNLLRYVNHAKKRIQRIKNKTIQRVYKYFYTLELYSSFLIDLKMNCKKLKQNSCEETSCVSGKRVKQSNDDEKSKSKKAHRQEECLKLMLLPDKRDEASKKDAIYAFNFYDKVEETFKGCNKVDQFFEFENVLKSFNPQKDSAAKLYNKLEKIFLPENPELAEIFLTFLLPSEAAEIGKFFAHFMVTNAGNFINKLNIYFNKQPAQLKKIYNCLSELADDPEVSIDKIKMKIVPLLKGNQFLLDWFLQLFPSERPSESSYNIAETVTLKDIETNNSNVYYENVPTSDLNDDPNEDTSCQLRFINGRIYYGYKIPLPAKLAFMAREIISDDDEEEENQVSDFSSCVHGISDFMEKRLKNAGLENCEELKTEDEDFIKKDLADDPSYEICDDTTLLAHAKRLNPSLYSSISFNQHHTNHSMHTKWKVTEDCKLSPKKNFFGKAANSTCHTTSILNSKERRKSPKKTIIKSPNCGKNIISQSQLSGAPSSNAIATAKKLKTLVEDDQADKLEVTDCLNDNSDCLSMVEPLLDVKKMLSDSIKINNNHDLDDNNKENSDSKEKLIQSDCKISEECNSTLESSMAKKIVWKRDEDKIILEEAKRGYANEDMLISRIKRKMSYRSKTDILDRHNFLLAVLSKLRT